MRTVEGVDSFDARGTLTVADRTYEIFRTGALQSKYDIARLPFSLKILLENLLRNEDGESIRAQDIEALATWDATEEPSTEIAFTPARVLMQDFTGVPAVVDLAAMREAMGEMGGEGAKINPLVPAELVIDHSVQVDVFASPQAFQRNAELGFKLVGELQEGATATDLVLTVTEMLRRHGVVGKFVEFYGEGLANLPLADRATIGNMSPEFGSTCAIFPIDSETLRYLSFSGRPPEQIELVEAYAREQGLWHDEDSDEPTFTERLELDLATVVPSIAGPKRPQDRVSLTESKAAFRLALEGYVPDEDLEDEALEESFPASDPVATHVENGDGHEPIGDTGGVQVAERPSSATPVTLADGTETELDHGHVVIAAITSCTNTSNPSVMIGAGILARNAVQRGLGVKPWVKTSLAPGSKVVTEYLDRAGLTEYLDALGFNLVGYGCTTCIGNSGPLPQEISDVVQAEDLAVVSVLSGNRNFEGRINPDVKMNYLASPPLCVAYAIAGTMDTDLYDEPPGEAQP